MTDRCKECGGRGVEFRGHGLNTEHRICTAYKTTSTPDGHPPLVEVFEQIRNVRTMIRPSGRFA